MTDFGVAVGLVRIRSHAEEADVVDSEVPAEMIVVTAGVEMLAREVEVGDARRSS